MNRKNVEKLLDKAAAIEAEQAREAREVGYMARVLTQATLPHKATPGTAFTRCNGVFSLAIMAHPDVGLPYGSIPRLLLSWMTTEAVRTRSPFLELGPSLSSFLAELGLAPIGGPRGDITRLRNQMTRLFASSVSCIYQDDERTSMGNLSIVKAADLWWNPKRPDQGTLWKSTLTLGTDFFEEIIKRPVPIDMRALQALKRSPLALDIYCWLTYRMSYLEQKKDVPWLLLKRQFGSDYANDEQGLRDFKKNFLKHLKSVHAIYPQANLEDSTAALILKPSPPHVPLRPTAEALTSKRRNAGQFRNCSLEQAMLPLLEGDPVSPLALRPETFEKAKKAAPGFDVYALEQDWREWCSKKEPPKNPDSAFIGFCRAKARQKPV